MRYRVCLSRVQRLSVASGSRRSKERFFLQSVALVSVNLTSTAAASLWISIDPCAVNGLSRLRAHLTEEGKGVNYPSAVEIAALSLSVKSYLHLQLGGIRFEFAMSDHVGSAT